MPHATRDKIRAFLETFLKKSLLVALTGRLLRLHMAPKVSARTKVLDECTSEKYLGLEYWTITICGAGISCFFYPNSSFRIVFLLFGKTVF